MTPLDENPTRDDDRLFDLLADGELDEAQRRELLTALEQQPDGWRRCALAFLEAQCWKESLGAAACTPHAPREAVHHAERDEYAAERDAYLAAAAEPPATSVPSRPAAARRLHLSRHLGTLAAMAACFLIALGLGTQLPHFGNGGGPAGDQPGQLADRHPVEPPKMALPHVAPGAGGWHTVQVSLPDGPQGNGRSIELPACERSSVDPAWVQSLPPTVTPEVLRNLQRLGYEVRQRRGLLPIDMNDGRRLVLPVDRVEVQYVGNPAY